MENCIYYCQTKDSNWYMCIDCGYKERFRFLVCPVCQNRAGNAELQQAVRNSAAILIAGRLKKQGGKT